MDYSFKKIKTNKFSRGNMMMIVKYIAVDIHKLSHNFISPTYTKNVVLQNQLVLQCRK